MRFRLLSAGALAAAGLGAALLDAPEAPAQFPTAGNVVAGPIPISYTTTSVATSSGEPLSFLNADLTAPHDVASEQRGLDGSFVFKSEIIPGGQRVPVRGAERLNPGSYAFFCTVHPWMEGTLAVRGPDAVAPSLRVRILDKRIAKVRRKRKLRMRVTVDEPARVRLEAKLRGKRTLAKATKRVREAGSRKVVAKLSRAAKRRLRGKRRARIEVSARAADSAGNASTSRARKRLR